MAGIYVHVPFCRQRCSYCDFYFVTSPRQVEAFVGAVSNEIALRANAMAASVGVDTVYFGGGTPSRLTPAQLGRILDAIRTHFDTSRVKEITVEVNPDDPDDEYLDALLAMGINRLSIGVQSLHDADLSFMHRSHTADEARSFVERALRAGFTTLSIDLIFGLPEMAPSDWRKNLDYAVASGAQHVSLYGLTVEPGTLLGKWVRTGQVSPASEARLEKQFRMAHEVMTSQEFEHYEISNFAKPGHHSRHNQSYWDHSPYVGFGPAAHSFRRLPDPVRWENVRSLRRYLELLHEDILPVASQESLTTDLLMREYVLLSLRTSGGIDLDQLADVYGFALSGTGRELVAELVKQQRVSPKTSCISLTLDGFLVADTITSRLLSDGFVELPRHQSASNR